MTHSTVSTHPDFAKSVSNLFKSRINVLFDTDTNNGIDDQHALAYLLFNGDVFKVAGVTVNATHRGGDINQHYEEAERVIRLCNQFGRIPLLKGANGNFEEIMLSLKNDDFDGSDAVNFIIEQARGIENEKLVLLAVGKLTNIALALKKDPSIIDKVRIVWLGSNYPDPGEYNLENDIHSLNYILSLEVSFEMVVVRYNQISGTGAVTVSLEEIKEQMPGLGTQVDPPIIGRHSGKFQTFGDYSVSLFENFYFHEKKQERALHDLVAAAVVKNSAWANLIEIPTPVYFNGQWVEQPHNQRKIKVWENFKRNAIINDFFSVMHNYILDKP